MNINQVGFSSKPEFEPQINLKFIFSTATQMPVYYRIFPGNIREIIAIKLSLKESELKNVILIGDKGFYSQANEEELLSKGLHYILPLRRNSTLIDYNIVKQNTKAQFDGYFLYEDRVIWHYRKSNLLQNVTFA